MTYKSNFRKLCKFLKNILDFTRILRKAYFTKTLINFNYFAKIGEKFRSRALKFPGLISGCTVDWFQRWPKEALISVADHFLSAFNVVATADVKKQLVQCMGTLHDEVAETCASYFAKYRRTAHVTPKSYLSFLNGYKTIYTQKHSEIDNLASRMNVGLEKLLSAGESVAVLAKELAVKEQELEVANEKADRVLKEVAKKKEAAEKIKAQGFNSFCLFVFLFVIF